MAKAKRNMANQLLGFKVSKPTESLETRTSSCAGKLAEILAITFIALSLFCAAFLRSARSNSNGSSLMVGSVQ